MLYLHINCVHPPTYINISRYLNNKYNANVLQMVVTPVLSKAQWQGKKNVFAGLVQIQVVPPLLCPQPPVFSVQLAGFSLWTQRTSSTALLGLVSIRLILFFLCFSHAYCPQWNKAAVRIPSKWTCTHWFLLKKPRSQPIPSISIPAPAKSPLFT